MKRRIAWLALPLVLCALMLGVKWRAEHPPVTTEDLEVRAVMLKSTKMQINDDGNSFQATIPPKDVNAFIDCLHVLPLTKSKEEVIPGGNGCVINFILPVFNGEKENGVLMEIYTRNSGGKVSVYGDVDKEYYLHPVTIRRWRELLLSNSSIPPDLRLSIERE